MQLEIKVEELRKRKLFVATPMYGGMCLGMYMKSCLDLQGICQQYGIECRFSFIFNESLITRARNYLCDEFVRSGMTHMLFLDADIHFDPRDVIAMLAMDKDVVGAPYPKKSIKWGSVIQAVKNNLALREKLKAEGKPDSEIPPEISPADVESVTGDYVFNAVAGTGQFSIGEPLEVMELGTGFMMIKKEVFTQWEAQYPEYRYKPDHVGQANFDGTRYIHAYFDTIIDRGPNAPGESERYLSEDYFFCQMWRKMGGKIFLCPWMKTHHVGTYAFHGNMQAVAQHVGSL